MADNFYPFVENGQIGDKPHELLPQHPARIAVYDDISAAPRVVVVEPKGVRDYLEEITLQVTQLSQAQGGSIPFMVIREIVENLIHAYFIEPTVSILDHGNTIRFSDQGPGIREKHRAMQYGTTSATEEMRRYIRGVGSGLPYVQQYMADKGGSLHIEDNMAGGTVVTIHAVSTQAPPQVPQQQGFQQQPYQQQPYQQPYQQQSPMYGQPQPMPQQAPAYPAWQQQPMAPQQQWPQNLPPQNQQWPAQQGAWQQPYAPTQASATYPQPNPAPSPQGFEWVTLTERGRMAVEYLRFHESVGPSDLARAHGGSQPTWTRELKTLEDLGLVLKDGQKRRLTSMGRAYIEHFIT